jgi:hypothetical protein
VALNTLLLPMRLASIAAAALLCATPLAAQSVSKDAAKPTAAAAAAAGPLGTYDWAIEAGGNTYTGSLLVTKVDTGYAVTVSHGAGRGDVKAKSVKVTGDHLLVVSDTEFGDLTMDIKVADTPTASWSVGDGTNNGEMKIVRRK